MTYVPQFEFASDHSVKQPTASEIIRFRETTRSDDLLEQPLIQHQFKRRNIYIVSDPGTAQDVLLDRHDLFPKAKVQTELSRKAFGVGISGTLNPDSARQRAAFQPLFSKPQAQKSAAVSRDAVNALIDRWVEAGRIDLSREMAELALQIAWATFLGPNTFEEFSSDVREVCDEMETHAKQDFVANATVMHQLAEKFEEQKRYERVSGDNPISALARPEGWTGTPPVSQKELRINTALMAASGQVTTGLTLAWALWMLGQEQELQDRISAAGDNNSVLLRRVIMECLRLWTPAAETMRDAHAETKAGDQTIEAGSLIILSFYFLHRRRDVWEDADRFDPDRFSHERSRNRAKGSFMPFSGGSYGCPGQSLAWVEITSILQTIMEQCVIETSENDAAQVGLEAGICIYPDRPLWVKVTRRS